MSGSNHAKSLINLDRYPVGSIDELNTAKGKTFTKKCAATYRETGLCALPEFIVPKALIQLSQEAQLATKDAYFCDNTHNAYLTDSAPNSDQSDVHQRLEKTFVGSVPYDKIRHSELNQLYLFEPLKEFIRRVLAKEKLYRFADPLGACSINVFVDGGCHGWHFDESEFTVTLMLQAPTQGGHFEYVPGIRGNSNEAQLLEATLNGSRDEVVELPFTPGTLLIFAGQQTLHRVTAVTGPKPRLVPVLCYAEEPDLKNSPEVRTLFWGRTAEEHPVIGTNHEA